jgi:hypothetical protein
MTQTAEGAEHAELRNFSAFSAASAVVVDDLGLQPLEYLEPGENTDPDFLEWCRNRATAFSLNGGKSDHWI